MRFMRLKKVFSIGSILLVAFVFTSCSDSTINPNCSVNTKTDVSAGNKLNNQTQQSEVSSQNQHDTTSPDMSEEQSNDEVITDIQNWNHPVKDVFKQNNVKVNKVELLCNKVFPVFHVEYESDRKLDAQGAKYFDVLMKKIASANGYWNFKVIDDKRKLVFDVVCDKEKKAVLDIAIDGKKGLFNEMIDYNNSMIEKWDKATEYLTQSVPEIKQFEEKISKESNGEVSLIIRLDGVPDKYSDNEYKDYFDIYVGENHPDHTTRWNSFYVNAELSKIMVEDIVTGELVTLEQWRKSTYRVNEAQKESDKKEKISGEEAIQIINKLISQKKIRLSEPDSCCQIQNYEIRTKDNVTYYIIRIAYIDPNNKENTETLARYWVTDTTREVFQEDLWTGDLTQIS